MNNLESNKTKILKFLRHGGECSEQCLELRVIRDIGQLNAALESLVDANKISIYVGTADNFYKIAR